MVNDGPTGVGGEAYKQLCEGWVLLSHWDLQQKKSTVRLHLAIISIKKPPPGHYQH